METEARFDYSIKMPRRARRLLVEKWVSSPLVIPLFVIQFITTQVKVWRTLNHLLVTQKKWYIIVVYCMTNERLIIIYSFWCKYAMIWYSTILYIPKCLKSYYLNKLIITGEQYFTIIILLKHLYLKDRCVYSSLE